MCGILGILRPAHQPVDIGQAKAALRLLRHRGPDDEGFLLANSVDRRTHPYSGPDSVRGLGLPSLDSAMREHHNLVLGHRRLSIIDLSSAAHQPMRSRDGRYWLVFNGEIYNYKELRAELRDEGHLFTTASDTEVVLTAYQQWGEHMLARFVGMFALAIWDSLESSLFLGRDQFGIKPLYYSRTQDQFAFASEIKPLLALETARPRGNPRALYDCLAFGIVDAGADTLFDGIHQLPAAHHLRVRPDAFCEQPKRYWQIDTAARSDLSFPQAAAELRRLFDETMDLHMRSDVPVGSCLSGGVDSSAIVLQMMQSLPQGIPLHTFSYISDDELMGEGRYVKMVCDSGDIVSHHVQIDAEDLSRDLENLVYAQEQPFMGPSVYAQYRVFQCAHQYGIKVMQDGQGADEIFAGYFSMIGARVGSLLSRGQFSTAHRLLRSVPANMREFRGRMALFSATRLVPTVVMNALSTIAGVPSFPKSVNQNWFVDRGIAHHMRPAGRGVHSFKQELRYSIDNLSLPQLLRYEDRNSMTFSIESRVPFCSPALAEFAFSLPDAFLLSNEGVTKSVLKEALKGLVPQAILTREKVGFTTPTRQWIEELRPWMQSITTQTDADALPFIDRATYAAQILGADSDRPAWAIDAWRCFSVVHWSQLFDVEWS